MAGKGSVLASRILNEISSLEMVVARAEIAWKAAATKSDELYFAMFTRIILARIK